MAAPRAWVLSSLSFLLVGCPKPSASTSDAGAVTTPAVDAAVSTGPSIETPPKVNGAGQVITPAKLKQNVPVTLSGVYQMAKSPSEDETACLEEVVLDTPIHVVDDKGEPATDGRGKGPHPVIGDATKVCIWDWKKPTQLPSGSRVNITGTLSTPMAASNPRAILVFGAVVMASLPPSAPAPVGALPDGDSVVFVRSADATTRAVALDLAYLYWGDTAAAAAEATGNKPPTNGYFIVNQSPQLRTVTLPKSVRVERLQQKPGGGWEGIPLEKVTAETQPFIVRVDKGAITELREINLP